MIVRSKQLHSIFTRCTYNEANELGRGHSMYSGWQTRNAKRIAMHALTTTLAALGACAATGVTNGDMAVKAQIDITRPTDATISDNAPARRHAEHNVIALYFRGDQARLEMQNGIVALFNGTRNRVYIVSDRNRTYYSTTMPSADYATRLASRRSSATASATITHPREAAGQTIAGNPASKFNVFGATEFANIPSRFSRTDDGSESLGTRGTIKMDGELWASDKLRLPTNSALVLSAITSLVAYGATELHQSLQTQLITLNEFPLRSKIVINPSCYLAATTLS